MSDLLSAILFEKTGLIWQQVDLLPLSQTACLELSSGRSLTVLLSYEQDLYDLAAYSVLLIKDDGREIFSDKAWTHNLNWMLRHIKAYTSDYQK